MAAFQQQYWHANSQGLGSRYMPMLHTLSTFTNTSNLPAAMTSQLTLRRVLINLVQVRFAPKATEILRCRQMTLGVIFDRFNVALR